MRLFKRWWRPVPSDLAHFYRPVPVTAIWTRTFEDKRIQVLAEVDGKFRLLHDYSLREDGLPLRIGHITEAEGIRQAAADPLYPYEYKPHAEALR